MATRRKAKGRARGKRKKAPITKAATRSIKARGKKTAKKAKLTAKTAIKPAPVSAPTHSGAAIPTSSRPPQPAPWEERIGVVTHYYSHLSVATMRFELGTKLHVGDVIRIRGNTTDFTQKVESLEVDHAPVAEAGPTDDFGLKVIEHAREHDTVFRVRS